jgi:hypothetical protein
VRKLDDSSARLLPPEQQASAVFVDSFMRKLESISRDSIDRFTTEAIEGTVSVLPAWLTHGCSRFVRSRFVRFRFVRLRARFVAFSFVAFYFVAPAFVSFAYVSFAFVSLLSLRLVSLRSLRFVRFVRFVRFRFVAQVKGLSFGFV